ncbi:MAG: fimbrial assembly protein [Burkholderiaceae bacterium]|nr:MAG: fimbrial assembly protein [Burkholderiaceae bacterium]
MSLRINLLPHREAKRAQRRRDFYAMLVLGAIAALAVVVIGALYFQALIVTQNQRNEFIQSENKKLDEQIKEVSSLKEEIEGLRARQTAVEDLQTERNLPVHLLDEMVKLVPEGVHLKTLKQAGKQVTLTGIAQSNERVSELLRNLGTQSQWIERPELIEIRSEAPNAQKTSNRPLLFEFSLTTLIKGAGVSPEDSAAKTAPGKARK